jgi:hypothetical protein
MSRKKLKWKPVVSFSCILVLLLVAGSLISPKIGYVLAAGIIGSLATISSVIPQHYERIRLFWFDEINSATHSFFIWLTSILGVVGGWLVLKNYDIDVNFKKAPNGKSN